LNYFIELMTCNAASDGTPDERRAVIKQVSETHR